ncbi:NHL repeat-containing protein, partial [bacterium]|nr:NHL repeat-containing protein [bacterium]
EIIDLTNQPVEEMTTSGQNSRRRLRRRWWFANAAALIIAFVFFSLIDHGFNGHHGDDLTLAQDIAHTIGLIVVNGKWIRSWGADGNDTEMLHYPVGLTVRPNGTVYVADTHNYRIQRFDREGNFLGEITRRIEGAGLLSDPTGLAVDAENRMHIADSGNFRILMLSHDGRFLAQWKLRGVVPGVMFQSPTQVAVHGNFIYAFRSEQRTNFEAPIQRSRILTGGYMNRKIALIFAVLLIAMAADLAFGQVLKARSISSASSRRSSSVRTRSCWFKIETSIISQRWGGSFNRSQ